METKKLTPPDITLISIAESMMKYINSPWNSTTHRFYPIDTHPKSMSKQSHGGYTVYTHSFWTASQILYWSTTGSDYIDLDINVKDAITYAFLHDIAKASHCGWRCVDSKCWYDTYSDYAYDGKGNNIHPEYCGDILIGKRPFLLECSDIDQTLTKEAAIDILSKVPGIYLTDDFFKQLDIDRKLAALTAYMHWEFGRLNGELNSISDLDVVSKAQMEEKYYSKYLNMFEDYCKSVSLVPSVKSLKMCILVSLGDIHGADIPSSCKDPECKNLCNIVSEQGKGTVLDALCKVFGTEQLAEYYPSVNIWNKYNVGKTAGNIRAGLIYLAIKRGYS